MIEAALKRQNRPSVQNREPEVVIGGEYQQLIINAVPDLGLDIVNMPGPTSIPILDFVRTQSAELSSEIAIYTSDLAVPDHSIKMASNGNLDSDHAPPEPNLIGTTDERPFKLKTIFFWGLGLLVLYTLLDAVFAKLRQRDPTQPPEPGSGDEPKMKRRRRRRTFGRSRSRPKTT
ncbi:hypothetical protein [Denitrobaculum tricleocarpae]|uniref:Uncharacterized protein n=1 Tax=Denitrobaculum tricleocarpae TaxID=2591009 RepID=A0A545TXZ9_9PROT|nr:hypothetical protein [Denitrobaculum tricleocarpae]TQV82096.1 hypothetical protein FKG95_07675 [Denitrobaculum tricleocarpae]